MDTDRFLDKSVFRLLRNAAATIKAISFFLAPIIAGGALLVYLVTTYVESRTALAVIAIISVFMIAGIFLGFWYYIYHICDPAPYDIVQVDCLLIVGQLGNHHRYRNERRQTIKARRNNVRLVEHRAHWTGKGSRARFKAGSLVDAHDFCSARKPEEDGRTHQWIYLGRPLSKGDEARIGIYQEFEDNYEPMHTYYREGGLRYRARNLTVTTRFDFSQDPQKVEGIIWNNDRKSRQRHEVGQLKVERTADLSSLDPTEHTVDYIVTVRDPKRYHSYGIRWEWPTRQSR